jgi:protein SCO1/2
VRLLKRNNAIEMKSLIESYRVLTLTGFLLLVAGGADAFAQTADAVTSNPAGATDADQDVTGRVPDNSGIPEIFEGVGITEKLGEAISGELTFFDEEGREKPLANYLDGTRPIILNFVYHNCPMLCSVLLESFTKSLHDLEWTPGDQFDVLTISFSATETPDLASRQKERYLKTLGRPEAADGWHFLTGTEENIFALANSVGFGFKWIEETKEYAHPAALIFMDGNGKVTRYIHGMNYPPADVRKALVEASEGRIGTSLDRILMYCYRYDPAANSYVLSAINIMKLGGFLTLLILGVGLFVFWRHERVALERRTTTQKSVAL